MTKTMTRAAICCAVLLAGCFRAGAGEGAGAAAGDALGGSGGMSGGTGAGNGGTGAGTGGVTAGTNAVGGSGGAGGAGGVGAGGACEGVPTCVADADCNAVACCDELGNYFDCHCGNVTCSLALRCTAGTSYGCAPPTQGAEPPVPPPDVCGCMPECPEGQFLIANAAAGTWPNGSQRGSFSCSTTLPP